MRKAASTVAHEEEAPAAECVHCGLCLDACPTYRLSGLEAESPRGRLYLMAAASAPGTPLDQDAARHLDSCLGCLACESACPSGVPYGRKLEAFRPRVAASSSLSRRLATKTAVFAARRRGMLRLAAATAGFLDRIGLQRLRRGLPVIGIVPDHSRSRPRTTGRRASTKPARCRVALLSGCGTVALRPAILEAAHEVLQRNSIEVIELDSTLCCGALSLHAGDPAAAARLARQAVAEADRQRPDFIVTIAAGCGAMLRHYGELLADGSPASRARDFSRRARDVSELLVELGFDEPQVAASANTVAYHDACHLLHGAGVARAPRVLLAATGARIVDLGDNSICCGSAGVYNLTHARAAAAMGRQKAELASAAGIDTVAVGNLGCILQIERALVLHGVMGIRVRHPIELLADAYSREITDGVPAKSEAV